MSYVIASERSVAPFARRRQQPSHIIPSTDFLDLSYDKNIRSLWIYLSTRAPAYVSLELIQDLLGVDNVFATSQAAGSGAETPIDFKIIASRRPGVFSLGGDLSSFRYFIDQGNRNALTQYATAALDAIWTNTQAAGISGMTTISLIQGEAQGGGFEAALSAQVLVAEKGSMFGFPEALFGMFPGMGGYALLAARTNPESARRLIGSTNRYPAEMLYEMGVVDVLAEPGCGRDTVEEWVANATPDSTAKYRNRFSDLDRNQLVDSIDEWVEQALCLNQRQLRTMGYILEAQKRASAKKPAPPSAPLRRKIEFADIHTAELGDGNDGTARALLLAPQNLQRYDEREFLSFVKDSRPWIYANLSQHGAMVFRDFCEPGAASLNRFAAALRTDRNFNPAHAVPTPAEIHDNIFVEDHWPSTSPLPLHNAYADCAVFPRYKLVTNGDVTRAGDVRLVLANTHAIYRGLSAELVAEFERRGLTYRRRLCSRHAKPGSNKRAPNLAAWETVFKTEHRFDVERKCRDNGLSFVWNADASVEIFNCAPACTSHPETGDRLWFNLVHLCQSFTGKLHGRPSLLTRLLGAAGSTDSFAATFSDGMSIPRDYIDEIATVHAEQSVDVALRSGDVLLVDNAQTALGQGPLASGQQVYLALF